MNTERKHVLHIIIIIYALPIANLQPNNTFFKHPNIVNKRKIVHKLCHPRTVVPLAIYYDIIIFAYENCQN